MYGVTLFVIDFLLYCDQISNGQPPVWVKTITLKNITSTFLEKGNSLETTEFSCADKCLPKCAVAGTLVNFLCKSF